MPTVKRNPIDEARRYLANAQALLSEKAQKEGKYYQDPKYVKLAGHAAYTGVLLALDAYLGDKRGRKSVDWYVQEIAKKDRKLLAIFNSVYEILHLSMSYDGTSNAIVAKEGLDDAAAIISWVETRLEGQAA